MKTYSIPAMIRSRELKTPDFTLPIEKEHVTVRAEHGTVTIISDPYMGAGSFDIRASDWRVR